MLRRFIIAIPLFAFTLFINTAYSASVEVVAEYPNGTFLENLDITDSGEVVFTNYFAKTLEIINTKGIKETFSSLPIYPASVLVTTKGFVVIGHSVAFTEGAKIVGSNKMLLLNKTGEVHESFAIADAAFLNGMTKISENKIIVADSIKGSLFEVNINTGSYQELYQSKQLLPQTEPYFLPGANGVKTVDDTLYVSSSANSTLYSIKLNILSNSHLQTEKSLKEVYSKVPIDDFYILENNRFIIATHTNDILLISADGSVNTILQGEANGITAIIPAKNNNNILFATTTGNMLTGGKATAKLLKITL